jgi:predicted RNase H-like HicB family nuclease
MQYLVVIEKGKSGYGAYVPDLPGCIAAGSTQEEVVQLIHEAIELHLEDLRDQGVSIPPPCSTGQLVEVSAA